MERVIDYIRGNVRAEAKCRYPERFVNICAKNGIFFRDPVKTAEDTIEITTHIKDYRRLRAISQNGAFTIRAVKKEGVSFFLWRIRKRYALMFGMLACIMAVWILSLFVWDIDVSGNETVPTPEILRALDDLGVGIGTFGPSVTPEYISNEILQTIPELAWITVNVSGSHADVLVREIIPVPEIVPEDVPARVVATKSGIIDKMIVLEGARCYTVGDTVMEGETLADAVVGSRVSGNRLVHAMAQVWARTWYEETACMPLSADAKTYTGEEKTKYSLTIAGKRINLYIFGGISWTDYDKITAKKVLTLPGGATLPISIDKDMYTEYVREPTELEENEAEEIIKGRLFEKLQERIEDGVIMKTTFETKVQDGVVYVTLTAECREQIAATEALTEDEITRYEAQSQVPEGETLD
ncbi:MAG: sporulation protein YqfD [Oscillospiraceae bacterium]